MPEKREEALKRARKEGFPESNVVQATEGEHKDMWFIAPKGIKDDKVKLVYANLRSNSMDAEEAAKIAWSIQNKIDNA